MSYRVRVNLWLPVAAAAAMSAAAMEAAPTMEAAAVANARATAGRIVARDAAVIEAAERAGMHCRRAAGVKSAGAKSA